MITNRPTCRGVDHARFREVLGQVPTAVTVVTATSVRGPVGLVIGSFVSVSLDPSLVGLFVDLRSTSWPDIGATGSFAVNVLAEHQQALCARFATRGGDKFTDLSWQTSRLGHPLLPGAVAWIDCEIEQTLPVGDHAFVVGRALEVADAGSTRPMVFHRGALRGVR